MIKKKASIDAVIGDIVIGRYRFQRSASKFLIGASLVISYVINSLSLTHTQTHT